MKTQKQKRCSNRHRLIAIMTFWAIQLVLPAVPIVSNRHPAMPALEQKEWQFARPARSRKTTDEKRKPHPNQEFLERRQGQPDSPKIRNLFVNRDHVYCHVAPPLVCVLMLTNLVHSWKSAKANSWLQEGSIDRNAFRQPLQLFQSRSSKRKPKLHTVFRSTEYPSSPSFLAYTYFWEDSLVKEVYPFYNGKNKK